MALGVGAALYAAMIFLLSSTSEVPGNAGGLFPGSDKLLHFVEFFILGGLLYLAFAYAGWQPWDAPLAISLGVAYGFVDEFHQLFVTGRSTDIFDALADAAGVLVAVGILMFLERRARRLASSRLEDNA